MNAWPFLIGRAKSAGYRVVVVPEFMADADSVAALSGAARDLQLPADAACVRELRGLDSGPVTIVYRCLNPHADDYGLGDGELRDGFGRPIRVTEGVILRSTVPEITVADLEHAHAAVAEAYRDFWEHERDYVRRTSVGSPLGAPGRPVRLEVTEPWRRVPTANAAHEPGVSKPGERRVRRGAIAFAAAAAVLIAGLVLTSVLRSKPAPTRMTVLGDFCQALEAGQADKAYGYTSPHLQHTLSLAAFSSELLAPAQRATTCKVDSAGTISISISIGTAQPRPWNVALIPGNGKSWLIDSLTPR